MLNLCLVKIEKDRMKQVIQTIKTEWFSNVKGDILSGIVVALALIPEAIAFAIMAGVDPMVGLYASFCIAIIISFVGGRMGMISAATGAMALLMMPLVKQHGLQYLLAATILAGLIQYLLGVLKVAQLMRFIPRPVMLGFVNALGILIFTTQLTHFTNVPWLTYIFAGITLVMVYTLPKYIKTIPAPLIAIVLLTAIVIGLDIELKTVGDLGTISQTLPQFLIPNIPFNFDTLMIILPYSISLAIVGLLESLLTASVLDDMTKTNSNKNREARGQGFANIINGFFGGMAGCAMIGQSIINVKSGGRGRLSTFVSGAFLMFLIIVLGDLVVQIPMAVLAGIMIMVAMTTFDWTSIKYCIQSPKSDVAVMVLTIIVVLLTHNLALGVLAGVLLSAIMFVVKLSKLNIEKKASGDKLIIKVEGQLFFASINKLEQEVMNLQNIKTVVLDFTDASLWDESAANALTSIKDKLNAQHINVQFVNLSIGHRKLKKLVSSL